MQSYPNGHEWDTVMFTQFVTIPSCSFKVQIQETNDLGQCSYRCSVMSDT